MDQQTPPPLAVYPAPKKPRPKRDGMSPAAQRALFLIGGIAIGGLLVMTTLRFAQPEPRVTYRQMPTNGSTPTSNSPASTDPKSTDTKEPGAAAKENEGEPKADEELKWDPTKQPFNPFDASLGSPMPAKEITGHIEPGPMVANPPAGNHIDPSTGQKTPPVTDPPEPQSAPRGLLVTMRLDVADPESAIKALQGVASKVGGSAIRFDEYATKPDPEGAIIFVSSSKYEEAAKLIESVGAIVVSDRWTGSSLDRIDKIERTASDRLSDLRIQKQELLIKFFDDAPQVKHVEEDTDRISKCVAALRARKPGPNVAVIKIKFLS